VTAVEIVEEPAEVVILRRECSVNGERFAPRRVKGGRAARDRGGTLIAWLAAYGGGAGRDISDDATTTPVGVHGWPHRAAAVAAPHHPKQRGWVVRLSGRKPLRKYLPLSLPSRPEQERRKITRSARCAERYGPFPKSQSAGRKIGAGASHSVTRSLPERERVTESPGHRVTGPLPGSGPVTR